MTRNDKDVDLYESRTIRDRENIIPVEKSINPYSTGEQSSGMECVAIEKEKKMTKKREREESIIFSGAMLFRHTK
jgi:hypothetical protein